MPNEATKRSSAPPGTQPAVNSEPASPENVELRRVREREALQRRLLDGVAGVALVLLDRTGHILAWNAGARELCGYSEAEAMGEHYSLLFASADRMDGRPEQALGRASRDGKFEEEISFTRKGGESVGLRTSLTSLRESDALVGYALHAVKVNAPKP